MGDKNQTTFQGRPRADYMPELMAATVGILKQQAGNSLKCPNPDLTDLVAGALAWTPGTTSLKKDESKSYFQEETEWAWTFLRHLGLLKRGDAYVTRTLTPVAANMSEAEILATCREMFPEIHRLNKDCKSIKEAEAKSAFIEYDLLEPGLILRQAGNYAQFRERVLEACRFACVVTGHTCYEACDACHIRDVRFKGPFETANGLLMRMDVHRMFDRGKILLNPDTMRVETAEYEYRYLDGKPLNLPAGTSLEFLTEKYRRFVA